MNFKFKLFAFGFLLSTGLVAQQNLGVNQVNPQAKVHVTQEGSQAALIVEDQASDPTAFTVDADGNVGVKNNTPTVSLDVNGTDAIGMPGGTTAQRPATPNQGDMRFNSDLNLMEYYDGSKWQSIHIIPSGSMQPFGGVSGVIPAGWLLCDGSEVSRTTYADLFTVIGTNYGEGDGTTTFNLPDMRGRFLRGTDNGIANDPDAGARIAINTGGNTGDNVGSYQLDAFQGHHHQYSPYINCGGPTISSGTYGGSGGSCYQNTSGITDAGYGSPRVSNETRPQNVNVNYIIKY